LYRFHNPRVSAAPADVAAHSFPDLFDREFSTLQCRFMKQTNRRADLTRSAVATLKAIAFDERRLKRMQLVAFRQTFNRGDRPSLLNANERQLLIRRPFTHTVQAPH